MPEDGRQTQPRRPDTNQDICRQCRSQEMGLQVWDLIVGSSQLLLLIYSASGFNQFGLYHDDCLYENDDVKEALRRLPAVSTPQTGSGWTQGHYITFSASS